MYLKHWRLRHSPFAPSLGTRGFFASGSHDEALARLHFLLGDGRRVGLLFGAPGMGRSLLLSVFAAEARRKGAAVARVSAAGIEPLELLGTIASQWGWNPAKRSTPAGVWTRVVDGFREQAIICQRSLLLVDDVEEATLAMQQLLIRLLQEASLAGAPLTTILACRPEYPSRIPRRLVDLAELRIDLSPWTVEDVRQYIAESLAKAGCKEPIFDESAIEKLTELSFGIPRQVAQLADLALLAAAGEGCQHVEARTVEGVYDELGVMSALDATG